MKAGRCAKISACRGRRTDFSDQGRSLYAKLGNCSTVSERTVDYHEDIPVACRADQLQHCRGKALRIRRSDWEFRARLRKPARHSKPEHPVDTGCVHRHARPHCRARSGRAHWLSQWRCRAPAPLDISHPHALRAQATSPQEVRRAVPSDRAAVRPTSRIHRRTSAVYEARSSWKDTTPTAARQYGRVLGWHEGVQQCSSGYTPLHVGIAARGSSWLLCMRATIKCSRRNPN
jgi:hypothetical protein